MAADQKTQQANHPPRTFTLKGKELACYQAGQAFGECHSYQVAGENLRRLKDHQQAQLAELKRQLLEHATYPIPNDHPLKPAIEELPGLADGLVMVAQQFEAKAVEKQEQASRTMGIVAVSDTAAEARWRPPLRAWALLALSMTVATTVATLAAVYATRAGW